LVFRSKVKRPGELLIADSVDVTIPVIPNVIRVDAKKVIKVIKKFFVNEFFSVY